MASTHALLKLLLIAEPLCCVAQPCGGLAADLRSLQRAILLQYLYLLHRNGEPGFQHLQTLLSAEAAGNAAPRPCNGPMFQVERRRKVVLEPQKKVSGVSNTGRGLLIFWRHHPSLADIVKHMGKLAKKQHISQRAGSKPKASGR